MNKVILSMLTIAAMATVPLTAEKKKKAAPASAAAPFTYYLLTLSWAPNFCAQPGKHNDSAECEPGKKLGFVVHGLWPQKDVGRGPENCGEATKVSSSLVQLMSPYMPTASLIEHEWEAHGTCSGLGVAEYFAAIRRFRDAVTIPDQFKAPAQTLTLSPAAIEEAFQAANPKFSKAAFRTVCTGPELQEMRVCFSNRDLTPLPCTANAGKCGQAELKVLPVR